MAIPTYRRFSPLLLSLALFASGGGVAHAQQGSQRPPTMQLLTMLQSLQVANVPELAPAINGLLSDTTSHMRMAPRRRATHADSLRAAGIVKSARTALAPYADVAAAERDGYVRFLPWLDDQDIYHYNNLQNVFESLSDFDATRPASLLYRKRKGKLELVGAMYVAVPGSTPADLDARLPLGVAHWHEHVNFCGPRPDSVRAAARRVDGTPVVKVDGAAVARWLRITTPEACATAGGVFVPRLFGWMAHVYLFGGNDPRTIWGDAHADHMRMRMHGTH